MVMVTEVTQPPWVGMRAANCLIERFPVESKEVFQGVDAIWSRPWDWPIC